jgi:hypothetical protein
LLLGGCELGGELDGDGELGPPPPPHEAPLSVQLVGLPGPAPMKPKLTEAPGLIVRLYSRWVNE